MFGGLHQDGSAINDLWILKIENDCLKWIKANKLTPGTPPSPRCSHSLTYFEKENALIISGGRDDRTKQIFSDLFLLTLDTLCWISVNVSGDGMIGRADHHMIHNNDYDFIILGGIDDKYHLSNKISFLTFEPS